MKIYIIFEETIFKIMLEEVKEHFKNAKDVRCLIDGKIFNLNNADKRGMFKNNGSFWFYDNVNDDDCQLCNENKGFAEIISYKKDAQRIQEDCELLDKFLTDACSHDASTCDNEFPFSIIKIYNTNDKRVEQFKKDNGLIIEPTELDKLKQSYNELIEKAEEIKQQIDNLK